MIRVNKARKLNTLFGLKKANGDYREAHTRILQRM